MQLCFLKESMDIHKIKWNLHFKNIAKENIIYDNWLDQYMAQLQKIRNEKILDLGCGTGNNTKYLLERDFTVIPSDYSKNAIKNIPSVPMKVRHLPLD